MKPTLLCYNLSGEKASKIRFAAMRLRVLLRDVRPDEYGLTLNDLCGLETGGENVPCEETFPDEMLVNFENEQLREDGMGMAPRGGY